MFTAITAFFSGAKLYALLGILALVGSLGAAVYIESLRLDVAKSENRALQKDKDDLLNDLAQSEADKARMRELSARLDAAVKERDARYAALQKAKKDLDALYADLRSKVDAADQACLDRDLPDSYRERLQ